MNAIRHQFDRAAAIQNFQAGKVNRYAVVTHGPFVAQRYVPKLVNGRAYEVFPQAVWVDAHHPQASEAAAFLDARNRAVRRAIERGISVSATLNA